MLGRDGSVARSLPGLPGPLASGVSRLAVLEEWEMPAVWARDDPGVLVTGFDPDGRVI